MPVAPELYDGVTIPNTFGALQIGAIFAMALFGIVTAQAYTYAYNYSKDSTRLKTLVGAVWVLELAHMIAIAYELYRATVTHYGRAFAVDTYPGFGVVMIITGLITTIVQASFAYRVWTVLPSPYRLAGAFCGLITASRLVMSLYHGIKALLAESPLVFIEDLRWLSFALLLMGTVVDVIIAASMVWYFATKNKATFSRTDVLIDKLVKWTMRTGALTGLASLSVIILYRTMPKSMVWLGVYFSLAKLYSVNLLSALNSRHEQRDQLSSDVLLKQGASPLNSRIRMAAANGDRLNMGRNRFGQNSNSSDSDIPGMEDLKHRAGFTTPYGVDDRWNHGGPKSPLPASIYPI